MKIRDCQELGGSDGVTLKGKNMRRVCLSDGAAPSLDCGGGYMKST